MELTFAGLLVDVDDIVESYRASIDPGQVFDKLRQLNLYRQEIDRKFWLQSHLVVAESQRLSQSILLSKQFNVDTVVFSRLLKRRCCFFLAFHQVASLL